MATIGLRMDHGTTGTDLASTLAKALRGDPTDDFNYAKLMSTLQTDEMSRALLREQTTAATYDAIAKAKANEYKHEELLRNTAAGEARARMLEAAAGQPAAAVTEAPVVVDTAAIPIPTPRSDYVPAESVPDQFISAFPSRPGLVPTLPPQISSVFPARPEAVPPAQMPLPTVTGRPEAPVPVTSLPAPISTFPSRPAGPQLAMSQAPLELPPPAKPFFRIPSADEVSSAARLEVPGPVDPRAVPEQPVTGTAPGIGDLLSSLLNPTGARLFGTDQPQPVVAGRPSGPVLPMPSPAPEAPISLEMLQPPLQPGPAAATNPPLPIPPQQVAVPDVNRPSEVRPPVQAEPPLPIEPFTVPGPPQPEQPVSLEPRFVPQSQPTTPEARPSTVPPPDPNADKVTAGTGDTLPAGAPTPPVQIMPGETVDHGDDTVSVNAGKGPVRLTRAQYDALGLQDAFAADAAGQTTKDAGTIKTIYDANTGFTPAQQAEVLSGGQPIGTKEEIAMNQATANPSEGIVEVDKRKYEVMVDAQGNKSLKLMPGQPAAGEANPFGTGDPAAQQNYMSQLVVQKPDPKTWTPQERQNYAIMASVNFKSDVKVTDAGKIVYVGGTIPPGLLPPGSVAGAAPAEAAPAAQAAPATETPAPARPAQPAQPAAPGTAKKDAKGRWVERVGDTDVVNYGGWRVAGQPAEKGVTQSVGGTEITQVPSQTGPTSEDTNDKKTLRLLDQSLESVRYMLDLKPETLTPGVWTRVFKEATDGTSFASLAEKYGTTEKDREYFRHALELIKDFSHADSGADVTKSDLITYQKLFDLPASPTALDLVNLQKAAHDNISSTRRNLVGNIFSDKLKALDTKIARLELDLDQPIEAPATPAPSNQNFDVEEK